MTIRWTQYFDAYGLNDEAVALSYDNDGNVYMAGKAETSGGTEMMLLKTDSNGTESWRNYFHNPSDYDSSVIARGMVVNGLGEVYLTGKLNTQTGGNFVTLAYNSSGTLQWSDIFDGSAQIEDDPHDIAFDGFGNMYVTGLSANNTMNQYATIKYVPFRKPEIAALDGNGKPEYVDHELMMTFRSDLINSSFLNNEDIQFAPLSQVLPASEVTAFYNAIDLNPDAKITVCKILSRFTTADSLSVSRSGDTVKMPPVWNAMLVNFPSSIDVTSAQTSLQGLNGIITQINRNGYAFLTAIDPLYSTKQLGIKNAYNVTNAGINIEPAWAIETGDPSIKVGVFDSHIYWPHEDFGDGTFSGSRIKGGWNYYTNSPLTTVNTTMTTNSHGTSVAGIIGAIRENDRGVAGIAGGAAASPGASLYSMVLLNNPPVAATNADIYQSIIEGAYKSPVNPNKGFGLHIQNHSWVTATTVDSNYLFEAAQVCMINGCLMVAGTGNSGLQGQWRNFPAGLTDRLVMAVGASGTDGKPLHNRFGQLVPNGDGLGLSNKVAPPTPQDDGRFWATSYFNGVDVIAPGCTDLTASTIVPGYEYYYQNDLNDPNYLKFSGTSAAAPHVAGLAALMLSRHRPINNYPNVLAPEDIEILIEKYAHDVTGSNGDPVDPWNYATGYDIYSGHGLADAGLVMQRINWPNYYVLHSTTPDEASVSIKGSGTYTLGRDINGIPKQTYAATCYEIKHVYHHSFPNNLTILDYWSRWGGSDGTYFGTNQNGQLNYVDCDFVQTGNNLTVTAKTYVYRITQSGGQQGKWWPNDTVKRKTAYSVYLRRDIPASGITQNEVEPGIFRIFPNPANNWVGYSGELKGNVSNVKIELVNMLGQVLIERKVETNGQLNGYLDITNLPSGMYLVNLRSNNKTMSCKLNIQK